MGNLEAGSGPADVASKYGGGEVRAETGGPLAYVAIAGNCAGAVSVGDCVAAMLLQRVLGMGGHVKYSGGQGKLAKAAAAASSGSQSVSAIGQMYSDAGLLGAMVVCEASSAGKVVGAVAAALRNAQVTDEEVAAAKKNMLADVYTMLEAPLNQKEEHGITGFDVWRGYASRKSSRVDCWNHNSRCTGCCPEVIISEIEYGSLWKPINSTFPRLPMSPRSFFLAGKFKALLGPPRTEMWRLELVKNFEPSRFLFLCLWTPNQRFAERQT